MELDYVKLKQIKPAISGYIRKSQSLLSRSGIPDDNAVHDIRVLMKKSRALLKLAAPQLDKTYLTRNDNDLREVGRNMRHWRNMSVHRKTLKELNKEFPDLISGFHENKMITPFFEKQKKSGEPPDSIIKEVERTSLILSRTGYRFRFETMSKIDPHILLKELEKTYLTVSDLYLSCRNNPKPAKLHIFRIIAKDFLYQLYIFRPLNPEIIKSLEKRLNILTQNLGKYNDLKQLIKTMGYKYKSETNSPELDELIIKIREKQDKYLSKVWSSAYKIFCPGQKLENVLGFKLLVI
jgi:CHAD domain-containing protein